MGWKEEPHWYLRGWEYQERVSERGRTKKELVYTGEYYSFRLTPRQRRQMKAAYGILTAVLVVCYVASALLRPSGSRTVWGGACILTIIPLIYLVLGAVNLLRTEEKMTYRSRFASWQRLRYSSIFSTILLAVGTVGELIYILWKRTVPTDDLLWLAGLAVCLLCSGGILFLTCRIPARLIPPPLE